MEQARPNLPVGVLQCIGFIAVVAIVLLLHPEPYMRPELWAEDGAEWLAGALNDGFLSCIRPTALIFAVMPRFIAFAAVSLLPLELAPHAFAWVSLLVAAFVISSVVRSDMEWIHPDPRWRLVLAIHLALMPALTEVGMALCNGSYMFGLAAILISLRDRPRFTPLNAAALALLMLSGPLGVLVPAVWAWRSLVEQDGRDVARRYFAWSLVTLVLIALAALSFIESEPSSIVYSSKPPQFDLAPVNPALLLESFASRLCILVVGLPLLGQDVTSQFMRGGSTFWILLVPLVLVCRSLWQAHPRLFLGALLGALVFPLMQVGRNYGPHFLLASANVFPFARWSLVGEFMAITGFVAIVARAPVSVRWILCVTSIQFAWVSTLPNAVTRSWDKVPTKAFSDVARTIEQERRSPGAETLTPVIPVHPHGWATFRIKLRRQTP